MTVTILADLDALRTTLAAVDLLLDACQKGGRTYNANPKLVADINRSGKRLRSAILAVLADQQERASGTKGTSIHRF